MGFITDGIMRVFDYTTEGEEITRYFFDGNHLIIDVKNFDSNVAFPAYLQAIIDCKLIIFSKEDWKEISDIINGWDNIIQKNNFKNAC